MHTPYIGHHREEHNSVTAYDPSVYILPPPRGITLPCALFEEHLSTGGNKHRTYGYQYIFHDRAKRVIPVMMMTEPMIFMVVMASPKSKAAISIVKISVVPLNINAVLISIRRNTCCHKIAYTPITPMAPPSHNKYRQDNHSCRDAIFVHIPTHAYSMLMPTNTPMSFTLITNLQIFKSSNHQIFKFSNLQIPNAHSALRRKCAGLPTHISPSPIFFFSTAPIPSVA